MTSTAKIEVQQRFCKNCSVCIKKELQVIENIKNVRLYPKESLITFNFIKADKLSAALNVLSKLGYPEKGERIEEEFSKSLCSC
ncbi:hypothetical protein [Winogradskyella haliclonae]|uniref:HMA domain-containing protein n=1 Tax=Winogradskyella haliclonae TaxID=2048558 RepID=A0ABQ2BWF8_9FLAO|nr:hypothetical protein [Winogradskyella haliclonae]GGI56424.1 hypothetical protein GCM10011444_07330 [Winogradskyella haliclonae]